MIKNKYITLCVCVCLLISIIQIASALEMTLNASYDGFMSYNDAPEYFLFTLNRAVIGATVDPDDGTFRSFFEFNISDLPNNIEVTGLKLNLTTYYSDGNLLNVTRVLNIQPSILSNDDIDKQNLWWNLSEENYATKVSDFSPLGENSFDLGATAYADLVSRLDDEYFVVGLTDEISFYANITRINMSSSNAPPKLIVTYNNDPCIPPETGNWEISTDCYLTDETYYINGNLSVLGTGSLDMAGTTNLTFKGSDRYIEVYSGANISIGQGSGFNL